MTRWMVGLVLVLGLAGCTAEAPVIDHPIVQPGKPGEANRTLSAEEAESAVPVVKPNDADIAYVRDMVIHHQQAVRMTALVPDRAADAQLKGLASRIADVQGPEIGVMNRWLADNDLPAVNPEQAHAHGDMPGMATAAEMSALTAAKGAAFDTLFLELMIRHHEGAIAMANQVQQRGMDVQVQEMADHVIAEQSDEINRMRGMLG
ncbi:DUF305 domain-containing protein [Actinokineospora sp. 24-640]